MKTYNQFVNESVRDAMKPKSKEELSDRVSNLSPNDKLLTGVEKNIDWLVKDALNAGADVNKSNGYPLSCAASHGYEEVVKILLDAGADIHYDNDYAFQSACYNGRDEIVKILLDAGANIHAKNDRALDFARQEGHTNVVKILEDWLKKEKTNESVRDAMKPKSKDKVYNACINIFMEHDNPTSDYDELVYDEISKILKEPKENLQILTPQDYDNNYESMYDYLESLIINDNKFIKTDNIKDDTNSNYYANFDNVYWKCYPKEKIACLMYDDLEDVQEWIFCKDTLRKINESVRDAMKPKSKEEIMNSLDGNPTVKFRRSKKTGSSGTFLIGEIDMNYYDIVELFGEPEEDAWIGNNFFWVLESSDNHMVTIYDNNSELEFYEIMEEPNYPWHIGGYGKQDYKDLLYYIYDKIL